MMAEWIVIIAVSHGSSMSLSVPATAPVFTPNMNSVPAIYHAPPPPPPPTITVVRVKTREEVEDQARGYYMKANTMWSDERIAVPGLYSFSSSRSVVVISPDGKVHKVESVERKKKVVREIEESDGWETRWEEVKP